ncbi:MAG: glycosyltransferase [Actinobacteria bacterium]|nr:glycosyltransferase [Actinomycetota bacterium]
MEILLLYQYFIVSVLVILLGNFLINNHLFRDTTRYTLPSYIKINPPLVSILIPARNEGQNIRRCLRSLARQDYPNFEIIVLDDSSSDNTASTVTEFSLKDTRIKLIKGKPLESGWLGKSFACQQLSEAANGDYLLFTDADTLHFKNSVSSALSSLLVNKLDAISVFARQITVTLHERMMVPFANYFLLTFFPFILVEKTKNPLFCTAIGQFMLFKRSVYNKIGGHESVKKEILEDIHISKQVKKYGYKFMIFDGKNNFYCRMYRNLREVINGYSKVLAAVFDYNIFLQSIVTVLVFLVYLVPFLALPAGIFIFHLPHIIIDLIILQIIIIFVLKIIQTIRFKNRFIDVLLFPVSVIYLLLISVISIIQSKSTSGVYWKGRNYDVRDEKELKLLKDSFK